MPPHARLITLALSIGLIACQPAPQPAEPPASAATAVQSSGLAGTLTNPASGANCSGRDVHISNDGFSLVLDGDCGKVLVTGSNGALNVEHARAIRVEGSGVTVLNSQVQTLEVTGSRNTLNMTEVSSATVEGDGNGLLGRQYGKVVFRGNGNYVNCDNQPELDDSGSGNKVM